MSKRNRCGTCKDKGMVARVLDATFNIIGWDICPDCANRVPEQGELNLDETSSKKHIKKKA